MSTVDLKKLREEIDTRKKEKNEVSRNLGEGNEGTTIPKDSFLNELLTSLKTGKPSQSTNRIKMVENKAAEKKGETSQTQTSTMSDDLMKYSNTNPNLKANNVDQSQERDALLYEEFERKKKELQGGGGVNHHNLPQNSQTTLNENVKKIINENFTHIVEQAMKDAIVEIYSTERVKEVMSENKEIIKEVVLNTIRELQNKSKAKKSQ